MKQCWKQVKRAPEYKIEYFTGKRDCLQCKNKPRGVKNVKECDQKFIAEGFCDKECYFKYYHVRCQQQVPSKKGTQLCLGICEQSRKLDETFMKFIYTNCKSINSSFMSETELWAAKSPLGAISILGGDTQPINVDFWANKIYERVQNAAMNSEAEPPSKKRRT